MCGIAGTHGFGDAALIRAMTDTLIYRGPDGEGFYVGDGVCLGNRRLAITCHDGAVEAHVASLSGGIVLKNEAVGVHQWVDALGEALAAEAEHSETMRRALERLLTE